MSGRNPFFANGHLDPEILGEHYDQLYVCRPSGRRRETIEDALIRRVETNRHSIVFAARQTGKTSLLYYLRRQAGKRGWGAAYLSLPSLKSNEKLWYERICQDLWRELAVHCNAKPEFAQNHLSFETFMLKLAERAQVTCILLAIDELDNVFADPDTGMNFLSTLRQITDNRTKYPLLGRWRLVMATAVSKEQYDDFIPSYRSPLNIAEYFYLNDLTLDGVRQLINLLKASGQTVEDGVAEAVYEWAHGHPYLTQRICSDLYESGQASVTQELVETVVRELIAGGGDRNLVHMHRVYRELPEIPYRQFVIRALTGVGEARSQADPVYSRVWVTGLIRREKERTVIRNRIYEEYLNGIIKPAKRLNELPEKVVPARLVPRRSWRLLLSLAVPLVIGAAIRYGLSWGTEITLLSGLGGYFLYFLLVHYLDFWQHKRYKTYPIREGIPKIDLGMMEVMERSQVWDLRVEAVLPKWLPYVTIRCNTSSGIKPQGEPQYTFRPSGQQAYEFCFKLADSPNPLGVFFPLLKVKKIDLSAEWPGNRLPVTIYVRMDYQCSLPSLLLRAIKWVGSLAPELIDALTGFKGVR